MKRENKDTSNHKAHSQEYFGEYRDFWWNQDFLELMSVRLGFSRVQSVLDVGCGIGHWGQILARVLPASVHVTGVDREESSLKQAYERAHQQGLSERFQYCAGDATSLPFPDNTFDMVTCQTVLIHLKNPIDGIKEMLRVLKPGGIFLAAEPNNFAGRSIASSVTGALSVDEVMSRVKFELLIERGKKALGLGYNSEGDFIPGYLAQLGAKNIRVYLSDKAVPLFPPYSGREQQVNIEQLREWTKQSFVGGEKEEVKRYYLAGGGLADQFESYWGQGMKDAQSAIEAIDAGTYHTAGGGVCYLVAATK